MNNMNYLKLKARLLIVVSCSLALLGGIMYTTQEVHAHFVKAAEDDKSPVCGMPIDKHPNWASVIMFKDGNHVKLHGPKNMFTFYFNMGKYDSQHDKKDIATMHVIDYDSLKNIKAKEAYYVLGCNVTGPMGDDLIPLKDRTSAETFKKEHGGKILTFDEITPEVINNLKNIIPE